jgi:hypothetical protein
MRKRWTKAAALFTCFAILCVPLTFAGTNARDNFLRKINLPVEFLNSIIFPLNPVNTIGLTISLEKNSGKANTVIKPTGEIPINRIGAGD